MDQSDAVVEVHGLSHDAPSATASTEDKMDEPKSAGFKVVAVGASAGGLSALRRFLAPLPPSFPLPLLIVQHLSPAHVSMLTQILARYTQLIVKEAEDGDKFAPGHVYISPPGSHLLAGAGGTVTLSQAELVHFSRPSVDVLFESVAQNYGRHGIAVVLTGAGRDGATGLRAVKDAGGVTIVQDPGTAEYSSMPHFAVATQSADHVLPLAQIPGFLVKLVTRGETK